MKRNMIKTTVVCLLLGMVGIVIFAGSAFAQPNLVPKVESSDGTFDSLTFTIKNIGTADAGPSTTFVYFEGSFTTVIAQVPAAQDACEVAGKIVPNVCERSIRIPIDVGFTVPTNVTIPKNQSVDITSAVKSKISGFPNIPKGCPGPDCKILIVADVFNSITELSEVDNIQFGPCINTPGGCLIGIDP